jgi:hypothetical protein
MNKVAVDDARDKTCRRKIISTSSSERLLVVSSTVCVKMLWATLGNIILGIVTFFEVVVGQIVESATVAATWTVYTGDTPDTLGGGGHFQNGLLMTEYEALFLEDERVTIAVTFCVLFIFSVGAGTIKALGDVTLVIFILFVVVFFMVAVPFFLTVLALPLV